MLTSFDSSQNPRAITVMNSSSVAPPATGPACLCPPSRMPGPCSRFLFKPGEDQVSSIASKPRHALDDSMTHHDQNTTQRLNRIVVSLLHNRLAHIHVL